MYLFTFQSKSQNEEITKLLLLLNLNYQKLYSIKFIYCITKESNNQNRKFKKILPQDHSCLGENTSSLGRDWTREHLNSRGLLAWATIPSPRWEYLLAGAKDFSPRQDWTQEHLSSRGLHVWTKHLSPCWRSHIY